MRLCCCAGGARPLPVEEAIELVGDSERRDSELFETAAAAGPDGDREEAAEGGRLPSVGLEPLGCTLLPPVPLAFPFALADAEGERGECTAIVGIAAAVPGANSVTVGVQNEHSEPNCGTNWGFCSCAMSSCRCNVSRCRCSSAN